MRPNGNSVIRSALYNHDTEPSCMNDAQIVFNSKLICVTETPNNAGNISFKIRSTPSCLKSTLGGISKFFFQSSGICIANCKTPATTTAHPNAIMGSAIKGVNHHAPAIIAIFKSTGENAGDANEP